MCVCALIENSDKKKVEFNILEFYQKKLINNLFILILKPKMLSSTSD